MALPFWYPPENEMYEDVWIEEGRIRIMKRDIEPYEISVEFRGWTYHVIFGTQRNGHFICIPRLHIGAELACYDDIFWNTESLYNAGLSNDMARMIAQVLDEVRDYLL